MKSALDVIKTWRERLPDGIRFCPSLTEQLPAMEAEITDLRAALAALQPVANEREAFEKWISAEMPDLLPLSRNFDDYQRVGTQMAWRAWQARASLPQQAVEPVANERKTVIEECASWIDDRREAFIKEHGYRDPDTGAWEYGTGAHADAKHDYETELVEIADGLRALKGRDA